MESRGIRDQMVIATKVRMPSILLILSSTVHIAVHDQLEARRELYGGAAEDSLRRKQSQESARLY